jgi:phage minor structural protein
MIRVYEATETSFANNGIKALHPLLAEVTKKDNDDYFVELQDTIDNLEYYQKGMIVRVPTPWGVQGFRCDNPKVRNNRVECVAWHLSYDANNYIIQDAYAVDKNCNDALVHFNDATDIPSPFNVVSDITMISSTRAVRKTLFGIYTEFISPDKYGGHWYRDNFTLGIKANIGQDRGVVLAQNKNITDMEISEEWDDVCTKVLAYTTDGESAILLDDPYVELEEDLYDIPFTKVVKFENELSIEDYKNEDGEENYEQFLADTKTWLRQKALNYLGENKLPKINYSVEAKIDNISDVGDVIYIKHPKCRVDITTNVIKVVYDAIRDKYIKIEFGNFKKEIKKLSQIITESVKKDTEEIVQENKVFLEKELKEATDTINGVLGNSYVIYNGSEIYVVDKLPKETATNVIKISSGGIGFSNTGINGDYKSAWTIEGKLDMQKITVLNLTASMIKGGVLKLGGQNNSSGTFELYDNYNNLIALMDKQGLTVYASNGDYIKLNAEEGLVCYDKNDNRVYWADGNVFHMENAEIENVAKFAGMIQLVPVATSSNKGIGFVAISN